MLEADDVIAATGFHAPMLDLPELGVATVADGRLPALTPYWESVTLPGVYFAGNVSDAAPGLRKHGVASLSTMVCGFRYNARVLARHVAEPASACAERPARRIRPVAPYLLVHELNHSPELAIQKGYLARVLHSADDGGSTTRASSRSRSSSTASATASRSRSSSTRRRRSGRSSTSGTTACWARRYLPPHPLRRYEGKPYLDALEKLLRPLAR